MENLSDSIFIVWVPSKVCQSKQGGGEGWEFPSNYGLTSAQAFWNW